MHAIWLSWKDTINCGCKVTDVVRRPEKVRNFIYKKEILAPELAEGMEESLFKANIYQNHPKNWYEELSPGDQSRNIIEIIFQTSSGNPSKHCRSIKKVFRVNNSPEMVERFERYRDTVKTRAFGKGKRHLRSMVDGNELLLFYGTTMNSCNMNPTKISVASKDQTCGVCRIIQSGFNTTYIRKNGIQLCINSDGLSEDTIEVNKGNRAAIVCRTIAGIIDDEVDENSEEYHSFKINRIHSGSEFLIVQNPSAVLPCFVVVFN